MMKMLNSAQASVDPSPAKGQPDLAALDLLADDALWEIVRSQLSAGDVTRLTWLLEENADNALEASERAELEARLQEADQRQQRRMRAVAQLQLRGHVVPQIEEL